jgi:putative acetyltransferase
MGATQADPQPRLRRLGPADADALHAFYNALSARSKRLFRPLGARTTLEQCRRLADANRLEQDTKYDVVAVSGQAIVGWGFLWNGHERTDIATLGLGVADDWQGRGLGRRLMAAVLDAAPGRDLSCVELTVVQDNAVARRLYESFGFVRTGDLVGLDGLPYFRMTRPL